MTEEYSDADDLVLTLDAAADMIRRQLQQIGFPDQVRIGVLVSVDAQPMMFAQPDVDATDPQEMTEVVQLLRNMADIIESGVARRSTTVIHEGQQN